MTRQKQDIVGEYFCHPTGGFILAVPADSVSDEQIKKIIRRLHTRYRCLLWTEVINGKRVIRPYDGLPTKKGFCRDMLDDLCKKIGIDEMNISGDLTAYDTSGILRAAMIKKEGDLEQLFCS